MKTKSVVFAVFVALLSRAAQAQKLNEAKPTSQTLWFRKIVGAAKIVTLADSSSKCNFAGMSKLM